MITFREEKLKEKKILDDKEKKKKLGEIYENQIKFKNDLKKKEENDDKDLANLWKKDYNSFVETSKLNQEKQINILKQNNEFLKRQIELKKAQKVNDMSTHEFSVNKDILSNYLKAKSNIVL